jgi:phosphoglycerol transferase
MGFVVLIGLLFYKGKSSINIESLRNLSELNVAAILLATIGGFGSLIALILFPDIRSYNRISVYIAFFSIFCFVLLLDALSGKYVKSKLSKVLYHVFVGLILVIGIFDQTTAGFVPAYAAKSAEFNNDKEFVNRIEASLPPKAMIFQLPYIPFSKNPPVEKMKDYDHLRAYMHSKSLRWSYGIMKGREGDLWQKEVAAKPTKEFVETIALAGFSGIYLDRFGYSDNGTDMEKKLYQITGNKLVVSRDNRLVFFSMLDYNKKLKSKYSAREWELKKDFALNPLLLS